MRLRKEAEISVEKANLSVGEEAVIRELLYSATLTTALVIHSLATVAGQEDVSIASGPYSHGG